MEDNKKIDSAVVAAISMALAAYMGDNVHDNESGHTENGVGSIDQSVYAAQNHVDPFQDGFDILGFSWRQETVIFQYGALATANVDVDNACRNHVLVAHGEHLGAIRNQVLKLFLDNKLNFAGSSPVMVI